MSVSIYDDKLVEPDEKMLSYDLANSIDFLNTIRQFIEIEYGDLKAEWKYYNKNSGWILKLFTRNQNILFVIPCNKYFRIASIFGDKATDKILNSELPEIIKNKLSEAKKYAEGRTIQIEVRNESDMNNILKLIQIKLAN